MPGGKEGEEHLRFHEQVRQSHESRELLECACDNIWYDEHVQERIWSPCLWESPREGLAMKSLMCGRNQLGGKMIAVKTRALFDVQTLELRVGLLFLLNVS